MGYIQRIEMWYDVLSRIEKESHCLRNKIGSILLDEDLERLITFGYNGNYRGGPNECDRLEAGNCGCIHAEVNALVKIRYESPHTMFVSETPCINCAKLIVNSGVKAVFALRRYRDSAQSLLLFKSTGLHYREKM